ncbi:hypothetical protein AKJ09_08490 [Labilithrix luteola]|uniref:TolB protein n=1 Tax=Labilithrix luteola TaxID=1391654 RepID=A0A0K1Q848_9BACT|nr:PD40 domain-containing protein [Labilithrix luteola]AKV01827.1 hypothetical protein AKJ09_08490 [Labilithrix luteola]
MTRLISFPVLLLAASCLVAGAAASCGSDESPAATFEQPDAQTNPLDGLKSLTIDPTSATLVAGDTPTQATFTAKGVFADGTSRDVTSNVRWSAGPTKVLLANGPLVSPAGKVGGEGQVEANAGDITATAPISVTLRRTVIADGAPADAATRFNGAVDATFSPELVYPLDGVLVPPNLDPMEIQWKAPAGATVFDLRFQSATVDVHLYAPCTPIDAPDHCGLRPSADLWTSLVDTLEGEDPVSLVIRAAGDTPGKIGESKPASVQMASTPVQGGLYYFNTRGTTMDGGTAKPGIYRYDFDKTKTVEPFFTEQQCAGCHALSKDGTKMLAPVCTNGRGCGRPMEMAVVDVATKQFVTPPAPVGDSDTQTWSPDNRYYVTTPTCSGYNPNDPGLPVEQRGACTGYTGGIMTLIDATTNTLVGKLPAGPGSLFPSFSNDGKQLVYARGASSGGPLNLVSASLFTMTFTPGSPPAWGTETPLLASQNGENSYYPSFSPDDAWVVFARSQCAAGEAAANCDTYDDPGARVFVVSAAGGNAIELAKSNGSIAGQPAPKLDNSWPKWSPFKGSYKGGDVFWVTYSTVRDYGFRTPTVDGNHVRQLWLVGFDIARAKAGQDPSFAPIWLPFQETTTSNHIGQWTEKVVDNGVK